VRSRTQAGLLVIIGLIALTAAVNGLYLNFVKPGLRIPLVAAGLVLVGLGAYALLAPTRSTGTFADPDGHTQADSGSDSGTEPGAHASHDHGRGPRVGWLLVVPFLILGVVVPPPLGSFSAQQDSGQLRPSAVSGDLAALKAGPEPVAMSLGEYSARALFDEGKSLQGRRVRLTGFVSPVDHGTGWALTRMALSCCAADGYAIKVDVVGGERLPDDTWIELVGTWQPTPADVDPASALAMLRIEEQRTVRAPAQPYE
jgi:uncharacterized repeat protein (TIGR03943 family)